MKSIRLLCLLPLAVAFASLVQAQDRVEFKRGGKLDSSTGQIVEETISTIRVKPNAGKEVTITPAELVKINYDLSGALKQDLAPVFALDEKRENAKALEEYKKVHDKVRASDKASPGLKRYVDYRVAMLQALLGEKEAAEVSLTSFLKAHPNSWQYPQAARQLASIQAGANKYDDAIKTLEALAASAGLPKEVKLDTDVAILDLQLQAGKLTEVKARADALAKGLPTTDPYAKKLPLYQIGATCKDGKLEETVGKLQKAIEANSDVGVKAVGFNVLGHCYLLNNNKREAMWQFLWVDTVYNSDPIERIKALDQLTKLFEKDLGNAERAQLFREKAARLR
jgi:tetratricopeptide (TPR) repeat protein